MNIQVGNREEEHQDYLTQAEFCNIQFKNGGLPAFINDLVYYLTGKGLNKVIYYFLTFFRATKSGKKKRNIHPT